MKKLSKRQMILSLGFSMLIAGYVSMLYVFSLAYFSQAKATIVAIDTMKESNVELFLLIVTLPIVCFFLITAREGILKEKI